MKAGDIFSNNTAPLPLCSLVLFSSLSSSSSQAAFSAAQAKTKMIFTSPWWVPLPQTSLGQVQALEKLIPVSKFYHLMTPHRQVHQSGTNRALAMPSSPDINSSAPSGNFLYAKGIPTLLIKVTFNQLSTARVGRSRQDGGGTWYGLLST